MTRPSPRRFGFGLAGALGLVLCASSTRAEVPEPWRPWLALEDPTGPEDVALARTQAMLGLGRAFMLHRQPSRDLERLLEELEKRISVLDAASLYELLGRGHPAHETARWFELEGRLTGPRYLMKAWRRAPRPDAFGDARAHVALRRAQAAGGFVLKTELAGHLGGLRFEHVAGFLQGWLRWLEADETDRAVELRRAFPRTTALALRYADIRGSMRSGEAGTDVRVRVAFELDAIRREYPHLGRMLDRIRGLTDADIHVHREQARLLHAAIDSKRLSIDLYFNVDDGRLVQTKQGQRSGEPIDLGRLTKLDYEVRSDLRSNISGLEVSVKGLKLSTGFVRDGGAARWTSVLDRTPEVRASGAFGIVPLWVVDALIPSDVETLARDFFSTMAEGNGGLGMRTVVHMPSGLGAEPFAATLEGELLSNGFLTFCLRTVLSSMGDREALQAELRRLWAVFLDAFEADLRSAIG